MTDNSKRLIVFAAIVHNAVDYAIGLQDTLDREFSRVNTAIDLFAEGKLSPGHFKAALAYRDYLTKFKALTETVSSVDTNYFLDSDYRFALPDEEDS